MPDYARRIPVHGNHCDPACIVVHAHDVRWMDEGGDEMAQARGIDRAAGRHRLRRPQPRGGRGGAGTRDRTA